MTTENIGAETQQEEQRVEPTAQERVALDAAQSGYARMKGARAATPAAPAPVTPAPKAEASSETPPADSQPEPAAVATAAPATPEANASAAPAQPDRLTELQTMLGDLRSQVSELAKQGNAGSEIRKLQGDIGSINRTLKQLTKSDDAPADLAAALAKAEKVAEDFPEIAGPIVHAIKTMQQVAKAQADAQQQPEPEQAPTAQPAAQAAAPAGPTPEQIKQQAAIEQLNELHPDRVQINKSPEFQAWLAKKPPEYQKRVQTTWNPAVLSAMYDEWKASQKRKVDKQDRLNAAVTPQGTAATPTTSAPTPEQLAKQGYDRMRSKRFF